MEHYYYIEANLTTKSPDLPPGPRVICIPLEKNIFMFSSPIADGPYLSIEELRKKSVKFRELLKLSPKRALKICQPEFIDKIVDQIIVSRDSDKALKGKSFQMIDHVYTGDVTKNNVSGVHYFDPRFHKIVKLTKPANPNGIWEAQIAVLRPTTGQWIEKQIASTFFPVSWSKEKLAIKLHEAFHNKISVSETLFEGITSCKIRIRFLIINDKIKSVYPIYE